MCELFALSSSLPTEASFSLNEFSRHGGLTDMHKDGWGIAYYEQDDARIIKEPSSASDSAYMRFVRDHSIRSQIIISHIRLATRGERNVPNTQPFARELGGKLHVFAHNGDLDGIEGLRGDIGSCFSPLGSTDSELAFCYLMNRLSPLWLAKKPPSLHQRYDVVYEFAHQIKQLGIGNFLYSDSDFLFIHSHKRTTLQDPHRDLPGLYLLHRTCSLERQSANIKGLSLSEEGPQRVQLVASVPLSNENWHPLEEGDIRVLKNGELIEVD